MPFESEFFYHEGGEGGAQLLVPSMSISLESHTPL